MEYTYRTLTPIEGHLLQLRIDQPTKGLSVELDYGNCPIRSVSVLDFIASSQKTRVAMTPSTVPERAVTVDFDGWVFPRSGVAFVWALDDAKTSAPDAQDPVQFGPSDRH